MYKLQAAVYSLRVKPEWEGTRTLRGAMREGGSSIGTKVFEQSISQRVWEGDRQSDRQTSRQTDRCEWPQTWTHSFKKQERDLEFRIISGLTGLERARGEYKRVHLELVTHWEERREGVLIER